MFDGVSLAAIVVGVFGEGEKRDIVAIEDTGGLEASEIIETNDDRGRGVFVFH